VDTLRFITPLRRQMRIECLIKSTATTNSQGVLPGKPRGHKKYTGDIRELIMEMIPKIQNLYFIYFVY
jgi:hypothetical protein